MWYWSKIYVCLILRSGIMCSLKAQQFFFFSKCNHDFQEYQEQCRDEIRSVIGDSRVQVDHKANLPFTHVSVFCILWRCATIDIDQFSKKTWSDKGRSKSKDKKKCVRDLGKYISNKSALLEAAWTCYDIPTNRPSNDPFDKSIENQTAL